MCPARSGTGRAVALRPGLGRRGAVPACGPAAGGAGREGAGRTAPYRRGAWAVLAAWAAILASVACGAVDEGGAGTGTGGRDWPGAPLPAPCEHDASPFVQEGCLDAVRAACNALDSEAACTAQDRFVFDGLEVACAWAMVVRFSQPETCGGAEVFGRCEPQALAWSPCERYCADPVADPPAFTDLSADPESSELIFLCAGPLADGATAGGEATQGVRSCAAGGDVPPPEPCGCGPQACEAAP